MNVFQKINIPHTLFIQVKEPLCPPIACQASWSWKFHNRARTAHVKAQIIQGINLDQGARKQHTGYSSGGHRLGRGADSQRPVLLRELRLGVFSLLVVQFTAMLVFYIRAPKGCKRYRAN